MRKIPARRLFFILLRSGEVLTLALTVIGLIFSAYQIRQASESQVQAAKDQTEAAELQRRSVYSELAMEAHASGFRFISAVAQYYGAVWQDLPPWSEGMDEFEPPAEVRLAAIDLDGAVARARVIDNPLLQACMDHMVYVATQIVEGDIPLHQPVDSEALASAFEQIPPFIAAYLAGTPVTGQTYVEDGIERCVPLKDLVPTS